MTKVNLQEREWNVDERSKMYETLININIVSERNRRKKKNTERGCDTIKKQEDTSDTVDAGKATLYKVIRK